MPITLNYTGLRITDAIQGALSTSLAAYVAAADSSLVPITEAEYNNLATMLALTKTSALDTALGFSGAAISSSQHITRATTFNSFGQAMISGYTVAAKICILTSSGAGIPNGSLNTMVGYQIGYGTSTTSAGVALSNPSTALVTVGRTNGVNSFLHFVVKNPSVIAPAGALPTVRYPGGEHSAMSQTNVTGVNQSYLNGAANVTQAPAPTWANQFLPLFQFLQTPTKQW